MLKKKVIIISLCLSIIIVGIIIFTSLSTSLLMNMEDINYDKILYQADINKGKLVFYSWNYSMGKSGIGLALFEDNIRNSLVISNSRTLSDTVTWEVLGTQCGIDCEPIDIIYGNVDPNIVKLKVKINNTVVEPELIQTELWKVWFVAFENIKDIQSIEAISSEGTTVFTYPINLK
jgi:hypothetical protein